MRIQSILSVARNARYFIKVCLLQESVNGMLRADVKEIQINLS